MYHCQQASPKLVAIILWLGWFWLACTACFRASLLLPTWWSQALPWFSLYLHPPRSMCRHRVPLPRCFRRSFQQPLSHHCFRILPSLSFLSHLQKVGYLKPASQQVLSLCRMRDITTFILCTLYYVLSVGSACLIDSVFSGGLLQPPVRMMPQPQPVRRIEPSPRFPSRNDRPELILRKEDRRSVFICFCLFINKVRLFSIGHF